MRADTLNLADAWGVLGLAGPVETGAATTAFRTALKASRPDQADGDETQFRLVIAAWRLIQTWNGRLVLSAPADRPAPLPAVTIRPAEALAGGEARVRLDGRTLRIAVPPGLRSGEHIRLKRAASDGGDLHLPVLIRSDGRLNAVGDDLYMSCPVPPRLLEDGGRLEIETHAGPRSAWLVAGCQPLRLRLRNLGLPARGARPQGHLFVTLEPSEEARSAAEDLLVRFTRVWTPDRLAA
jgi:curved DNA-binding protein